jgi:hypothetical protein
MKAAQYAVRGELYLKGEALRAAGRDILYTNVGNPHSVGGTPVTFVRQVLALITAPFLMDGPAAAAFPADAIARAKQVGQRRARTPRLPGLAPRPHTHTLLPPTGPVLLPRRRGRLLRLARRARCAR